MILILTVTTVGYLSFRNGQAAVNAVAQRLRAEAALGIERHVLDFLAIPPQINQFNVNALRHGEIDPGQEQAMQFHTLELVKLYPSVTSVYFGNPQGGVVGGGREGAAGALYFESTQGLQPGVFNKFSVDAAGQVLSMTAAIPNFDARTRPWYRSAVAAGGPAWSPIYILFTGQDMAIAASRPVYDDRQQLVGVFSVDIFLSQLSQYLSQISLSPVGQIFIMERSGALVAASTSETLFTQPDSSGARERLYAHTSQSPLIRGAAAALTRAYGDYQQIPAQPQPLEFLVEGERQFLQFQPVDEPYGLDWVVVVVIPESAFMDEINANNRLTGAAMLGALALAALVGVVITRRVTRPISLLENSARALAAGQWGPALDAGTRVAEIRHLALAFNQMQAQLRQTVENLTVEVAERQRAEAALRERDVLLVEAERIGRFGHAEWLADRDEIVCSDEMLRMFELPAASQVLAGSQLGARITAEDRARLSALDQAAFAAGSDLNYEYRVRLADGQVRWIHQYGKVVYADHGAPRRIVNVFQDITERKLAETEQQALLAEKDVLVKEVHHRVKNNLQVVISLLGLQAARISDPAALAVFQDSQERIRAIALVHEKLYQSPDLARINFAEYLRNLTDSLTLIFPAARAVRVTIAAELIWLGLEAAIPCGLIVNELVTNALKYAFPVGRAGQVTIQFRAEAAAPEAPPQFYLSVSDDGVGLPAGLDPLHSPSLGLHLVQILTRQLHGELTVTNGAGVQYELRFAERPARPAV